MKPIYIFEHTTWPDSNDINYKEQKEDAKEISKKLNDLDEQIIKFLQDENIVKFDKIENHGVRITAKNMIGTVNFSEFKLQIIPKIYKTEEKDIWKNIAQCIHFARNYSIEKIFKHGKIQFSDEDLILQDFLITTLVIECHELLKRGLLKSYVIHEENMPYLRGKLILKNQFQNDVRKIVQFFNEYDELEFDNIENRIIFQALIQSRRIVINSELKKEVIKLIHQFSGIVQNIPIKVTDITRMEKKYTRQNYHYQDVHIACKTILENKGISDFYEHDKKSAFSIPFFVDMNKIFEGFITRVFQDYLGSGIRVRPQAGQKAWNVTGSEASGIKMKPDIVLDDSIKKKTTIIDVKYKPKITINDLYQIGFYIHEYKSRWIDQIKEAYVILPKYSIEPKNQETFEALQSKIKIYSKYVSMDDILNWIKEGRIEKIIDKLNELIMPNTNKFTTDKLTTDKLT